MDPAGLATAAAAAVVRYLGARAGRLGARASGDLDAAVDARLEQLYEAVQARLRVEPTGERALEAVVADPDDARAQGRLEFAIEAEAARDPSFAETLDRIVERLDDLPAGGTIVRDAGPVAGRDISITAGRDAAGRDLGT
jgi:hypothetical protein